MPVLSKDEMKAVFKEALKEWMDDKFTDFGKWSAASVAVAALGALIYFIFWVEGLGGLHGK